MSGERPSEGTFAEEVEKFDKRRELTEEEKKRHRELRDKGRKEGSYHEKDVWEFDNPEEK